MIVQTLAMRKIPTILLLGALATPPVLVPTARADVNVHIAIPPPPTFVIEAPPRLVVVPDTPAVHYAPDLPYNFFRYGGRYYTFHEGGWFVAGGYGGPWTYVDVVKVPRALRVVPVRYYRERPRRWVDDDGGHRHHARSHRHRGHDDDDRRGRGRRDRHDRHDDD